MRAPFVVQPVCPCATAGFAAVNEFAVALPPHRGAIVPRMKSLIFAVRNSVGLSVAGLAFAAESARGDV